MRQYWAMLAYKEVTRATWCLQSVNPSLCMQSGYMRPYALTSTKSSMLPNAGLFPHVYFPLVGEIFQCLMPVWFLRIDIANMITSILPMCVCVYVCMCFLNNYQRPLNIYTNTCQALGSGPPTAHKHRHNKSVSVCPHSPI